MLVDQTILLDDGEVLHEDAPSTPAPAAAQTCCITYIKLENLYDGDLHVVAINNEGLRRERDFTKGKRIRKIWKKPVAQDDDDEGAKAQSGVIDGGLGRCLTLLVQIVAVDNKGKRTYQPDPPYKFEICCDDSRMVAGAALNRPEPPQDHPHSVSPVPLLKITEIVSLVPCPGETEGDGTSDHATVGSGVKRLNGVKRIDGKIFYGVWARFQVRSTTCDNVRFVQGVRRTVEAKYLNKNDFERVEALSRDDRYHVDVPAGNRTPEYPSSPLEGGGREMNDGPGVTNPWDGATQIDDKKKPFPPGTQLRITCVFRTWAVCLDTNPATILGRFDWTVVLHVTVGADEKSTSGTADPVKPAWSDDPDKAGYEGVAGQATDSSGFLPVK